MNERAARTIGLTLAEHPLRPLPLIEHFDETLGWHVHHRTGNACAAPVPLRVTQPQPADGVERARVRGDVFRAYVETEERLARMSWEVLSDVQIATLAELGIDRLGWTARFGHQLLLVDTARHGIPATVRQAWDRSDSWPRDLDELVAAHIRKLHGETRTHGADRMSEAAAIFAYMGRFWSGESGIEAIDQVLREPFEPPPSKRDEKTPFDGFISRVWPSGDSIVIGPIRLAGGLELLGLFVIVSVVWIPITLANTWMLVVNRRASVWLLTKAVVGWLVLLLVFTALTRPTVT
ncbi:MAG: hypothetical protein AABZ33_14550 [Chloroflexota bacterium]